MILIRLEALSRKQPSMQDLIDKIYTKINKKFEKEGEIKSENIRMCLLTELDECEPYIAKSWRKFDKRYKSQ